MKKLVLAFAGFTMVLGLSAQQDPQFTQNMFNRMAVNPAFAGASEAICGTILARPQWMGFTGAPTTNLFSFDMPINSISSGVGLNIISDNLGQEKNVHARAAYAYRMPLGQGKLSFGAELGIMNKQLGNDFVFIDSGDPNIPTSASTATVFDAGLGAYYYTKDYYVGLSASHLPQSRFNLANGSTFRSARHFYLMAGYNYHLNPDWDIRPMLFVKNAPGKTQVDINANAVYQDKYWGGLTFRPGDAIALLVGGKVWKDLKVGVSYDINTSRLNSYNNGSLELMVNYCFKISMEKPRSVYRNVRNL
jgi:type IX secretion system PorP/SprF family membrane protein